MTAKAEQATPSEMPVSKQVVLRVPEDLLRRVDEYAEKLHKQTGLRPSQAAVFKLLIERGLDAVKSEGASPRKR